MYEIADGFSKINDQGHKVRLATKFFDDEAIVLINMLQGGTHGLEALRKEAHDLGFVLGKESTDAASKYVHAAKGFQQTIMGLKSALAIKLMPAFTAIANFSSKFIASFNTIENRTSTLRFALLNLGGVFVALAIKTAVAFASVILTITAIVCALRERRLGRLGGGA